MYKYACIAFYERLAPTNDFDLSTPAFVRIKWVVLVSGSIQAASRLGKVMNPGWIVSNTFFFGFNCASGVAST